MSSRPVDIVVRSLPGLGVCQELSLAAGRRVGVVNRRDGRRELVWFDRRDPDAVGDRILLSTAEANVIAELLGGPQLIDQLAQLTQGPEGLEPRQISVPASSWLVGQQLLATQIRRRTGASVVAVTRAGVADPSPSSDFVIQAGDLLLAVGTTESVEQLEVLINSSTAGPAPETV